MVSCSHTAQKQAIGLTISLNLLHGFLCVGDSNVCLKKYFLNVMSLCSQYPLWQCLPDPHQPLSERIFLRSPPNLLPLTQHVYPLVSDSYIMGQSFPLSNLSLSLIMLCTFICSPNTLRSLLHSKENKSASPVSKMF